MSRFRNVFYTIPDVGQVQNPSNPECNTPSSEPFRICLVTGVPNALCQKSASLAYYNARIVRYCMCVFQTRGSPPDIQLVTDDRTVHIHRYENLRHYRKYFTAKLTRETKEKSCCKTTVSFNFKIYRLGLYD
jgi:hypothetical protein